MTEYGSCIYCDASEKSVKECVHFLFEQAAAVNGGTRPEAYALTVKSGAYRERREGFPAGHLTTVSLRYCKDEAPEGGDTT